MTKFSPHEIDFPYESKLNLSKLIRYWEANLESNKSFAGFSAGHIQKMIEGAPELKKPISDMKVLKKHNDLVGLLMSAVFPPAFTDRDLTAALIPFHFQGFYATPGYEKIFPFDTIRTDIEINVPGNDIKAGKVLNAAIQILNTFYGTELKLNKNILVKLPDPETGLKQIFKLDINLDFVEVVNKGKLPKLSKKTIRSLLDNVYDYELWLKHLKPEDFEFHGFTICRLVDVTLEEMLSSIKFDLLKKDAVVCSQSFGSIQEKIRSIFRLPNLQMGLSYFDQNNNIVSNHGSSEWHSFIVRDDDDNINCDCFGGSIYERAYFDKRPIVIEDLKDIRNKSKIEEDLIKSGIRNIAIAPLFSDNEVIGMLELGVPDPGKLNPMNAGVLESVLPMFTAAVRRELSEMQTEVRALIQKECTAIHPTVEWRFLEEGYRIMNARRMGKKAELESIVFKDVNPIYGMADVRNSSVARNTAIQQDLKKNLKEVTKVIRAILEYKNMPILDEINFRVQKELDKISSGLNSGDESGVLDFLRNEIVPTFRHFKEDEVLKPIIEQYEKMLDPRLGVIYDKRKDFEDSLTMINKTISDYLEVAEVKAQEIFPHYFEKYKTDGVEYNIYLGQSLVKDRAFDPIYLRNFRLWQLITMCEIANRIEILKEELPKKLDIAQLILVHNEPLSIKFRKDEKHFDVDGAYNIRYEIVKKRIDKAYIKNTKERLTQPGKISIVYTQTRELSEYETYIEYLKSIDYLKDEVEYFELEELQGAHGLRAIRVTVNKQAETRDYGAEILKEAFEAIGA